MNLIQKLKALKRLSDLYNHLEKEFGMHHGKAALFGLGSAVLAGVVAKLSAVCPDLLTQWPALLTAGVMAGIGVYLNPPKADDQN